MNNNQNPGYYGQSNNNQNQGYPYGQSPQGYPYGQPANNLGYYNQPQNSGMNIGQPNRQVNYQAQNYGQYPQMPNSVPTAPQKNKNRKKKIIVITIVVLLLIAVIVGSILLFRNKNGETSKNKTHREVSMNRTIMIYMVGSDLENFGSASAELNHIRSNNIDLENNNIVLIAGGSKVWGNDYINPDETSTYQLKESGFEKVKKEELKNMGETKTLSDFLNYVYDNYPAKKYELIFWNHGAGIEGVAYDDISKDLLTFNELQSALENSAFKDEKLDSILFMNSLLGNLELAGIVDNYANYMIASEELAYSHPFIDKFKFLEEIEVEDGGLEFGKKFVDNLSSNNYLNANSKYYNTPTTYSIIDLSKISQIEADLNNFIKKINVQNSYEQIALARSKTMQYGGENTNYDMVDLYTLVSNLDSLASTEAKQLMSSINSAVVHNYTSDKVSKGLSIYFPYSATENYVEARIESLESLSSNNPYLTFIRDFDSYRRRNRDTIDFSNNVVNATNGDYSMILNEEQKSKIVKSAYVIVKESTEGNFTPIYFSDNTTINTEGKLVANFDGKILMSLDTTTNEILPIVAYEQENGNLMTFIQLQKADKSAIYDANAYIEIKNGEGKVGIAIQKNNNSQFHVELPIMSILTLENYQNLIFTNHDYKITSGNGEVLKNWQSSGKDHRVSALVNHYQLLKQDLDINEKYYFAFKVTDLFNEVTYSKLVEIK